MIKSNDDLLTKLYYLSHRNSLMQFSMHKKLLFICFVVFALLFLVQNQEPLPTSVELQYNSEKFPLPKIPADNPQTREGIRLGRLLFYDKMLSGNNLQSCASCHMQKFAFTDGKKLAMGAKGDITERNTMSLVNLAWGKDFFWDGRVKSLEALSAHPISNVLEMGQDSVELIKELKEHKHYPALFEKAFPEENVSIQTLSKAIAQFLRTITGEAQDLPDSISTAYQLNNTGNSGAKELPYEFFALEPEDIVLTKSDTVVYEQFKKQTFSSSIQEEASFSGMYFRLGIMCTPCHTGESFGGELMANNLLDENQEKLFKVPTLLNVLLTAPYMRDGRFSNTDEILDHYEQHISELHKVNAHLNLPPIPNLITEYDKEHFTDFLRIFTDSSIVKSEKWSDPFASEEFSWEKL